MNTFVCISKMKTAIEWNKRKMKAWFLVIKCYIYFLIIAIDFNKFFPTTSVTNFFILSACQFTSDKRNHYHIIWLKMNIFACSILKRNENLKRSNVGYKMDAKMFKLCPNFKFASKVFLSTSHTILLLIYKTLNYKNLSILDIFIKERYNSK